MRIKMRKQGKRSRSQGQDQESNLHLDPTDMGVLGYVLTTILGRKKILIYQYICRYFILVMK